MNAPIAALALTLAGRLSGAPSMPPAGQSPSPAAVITFRASTEVRGRVITLGDIALVEGADQRLTARLEAVDVGSAPLQGRSRTVSAAYARVRIRQIGVDIARLQFHGPELVAVARSSQTVTGSALEKAAREAIEAATPGAVARLSLIPADLRLPPGAVEIKTDKIGPAVGSSGSVTLRVLVEGREEARVPVSFRLQRLAPVVVAAHDLPIGHVVTEGDLKVEERPSQAGPLSLGDVSQAVGQQTAAPIRAGAALTSRMLRAAVLIKRGARVRLICSGPGFVAMVSGEALENGAAGQPIRVRNLTSLREVAALVTDEQTAEVPF